MRVLVAPDQFAGSLGAVQVARAIADGWSSRRPSDTVAVAPLSDGGCGFVDVLHETLRGDLMAVTVRGPLGAPVPGAVLLAGTTAYVEASQALGHHLLPTGERDPGRASSYGVGELVVAAVRAGAARVVVGVADGVANDGGAGLLAALGASADVDLGRGPVPLEGISRVDLTPARRRLDGVEIVLATDDGVPLLGLFGTTKTAGEARGVSTGRAAGLDLLLDAYVVAAVGPTPAQRRAADAPGAGAGGGVGFGLLSLGATRESAFSVVAQASGLAARAGQCDLVLTGEASYDFSSRAGSVVYAVAQVAQEALRPCVVLAERVLVGAREMRAMGVESAYSVLDLIAGSSAPTDPERALHDLGARVARTWGH